MDTLPDPMLFIGGVERSGTTLLRNMLNAHPMLSLPDESFFIRDVYKRLVRWGAEDDVALAWRVIQDERFFKQWELDPALADRVIAACHPRSYADLIRALFAAYAEHHRKPHSADKTPSTAYCFDWYGQHFPDSRMVHLLRDPREVCMSLAVQPFYHGGIAAAAEKWAVTVRRACAAGATLGERFLEVRYENLVARPDEELRRLCEFARLPFAEQMLDYPAVTSRHPSRHFALSQAPPQSAARRWRAELADDDVAMIELIAGPMMARAGYELAASGAPLRVHARRRISRARSKARTRLERRLEHLSRDAP